MKYKNINSLVGVLKIVADDDCLIAILWENEPLNRVKLEEMGEDRRHPLILEVEKQLKEYFDKKRTSFNVPMRARGTPFQEKVWELLSQIPYGITFSYKDIAEKMDHPKAVRAVGAAIRRNPISIIIPCHRVVGSNGSLTGFAGGLDRKKTLLELEGFLGK
jgi:methylated-DNA-[protein]-cysteine S-methyltransferase